jgi:alpha-N-arabinofuranosidase
MTKKPFTINLVLAAALTLATSGACAAEFHVSTKGSDDGPGTQAAPFRTISAAAHIARPGDVITVHEGVYRERVNPQRGGTSNERRIVYRSAPGENVVIKGSEIVKDWEQVADGVWKATLPNAFFGDFNPYSDVIGGHWFEGKGREHHTGAVYVNADWLYEAASLQEVMAPASDELVWFGEVDESNTTIWAQFPSVDPNRELVEINARQSVFFPDQAGLNYITVRGFTMRHAATPWAPPTTQQIGLIGPHWSKGWIIEDNTISHAAVTCVSLGLGDVGLSVEGNAIGYTELANFVVEKELWNKEKIGGHIVRNNRISHCEAAGINGSFGAAFSLIENNEISNVHVRMLYSGMEQGGIKLHSAVDAVIRGNLVYFTGQRARGIWLDWMGQGAIIRDNLVFDTGAAALYVEVNHGPILVANNILLSEISQNNRSRGTAFVHNLFGGETVIGNTTRFTPYLLPHSTTIAGMHGNNPGDDRFYNNIFAGRAPDGMTMLREENRGPKKPGPLARYEDKALPLAMGGNLYINAAVPHDLDEEPMIREQDKVDVAIARRDDGIYLRWNSNPAWVDGQERALVTTEMLGNARVPDMAYEYADGSAISIDTDYFNSGRNVSNPAPGPFALSRDAGEWIRVWPRESGERR